MQRLKETPAIVIFGILMALWFGVCLIVQPFYPIAPGLFLAISARTSVTLGIVITAIGLVAVRRPASYGMTAVFTVCAIRAGLAVETRNAFPAVLWATLFLLTIWRMQQGRKR